jgi:hypothetical protein
MSDYSSLELQLMKDIADLTESNEQYQKQLEDANLDNIARRKDISVLKAHIELHAGDCCSLSNESDMFRERAEEAEAELVKSQWISVNERLPEGENSCRVYVLNDGMAIVGGYIPENNEWFYIQETGHFHSSGNIEKVTHWMPLPNLPE